LRGVWRIVLRRTKRSACYAKHVARNRFGLPGS
jgi:hypothetical protein